MQVIFVKYIFKKHQYCYLNSISTATFQRHIKKLDFPRSHEKGNYKFILLSPYYKGNFTQVSHSLYLRMKLELVLKRPYLRSSNLFFPTCSLAYNLQWHTDNQPAHCFRTVAQVHSRNLIHKGFLRDSNQSHCNFPKRRGRGGKKKIKTKQKNNPGHLKTQQIWCPALIPLLY